MIAVQRQRRLHRQQRIHARTAYVLQQHRLRLRLRRRLQRRQHHRHAIVQKYSVMAVTTDVVQTPPFNAVMMLVVYGMVIIAV